MPASSVSVNLLHTEESDQSPIGRIVSWAITYGRYIMITTEIVVLLAFISRFSLDRKMTDLNEAIEQKKSIIEVNQQFENDFKVVQNKVVTIKKLMDEQTKLVGIFTHVKTILPLDVYLTTFNLTKERLTANVTAATNEGFTAFLNNLKQSPILSTTEVGEINRKAPEGIMFTISTRTGKPEEKPIKKAAVKEESLE